jgi:hypothetical protein
MVGRGAAPDPLVRVQGARARDETTEDVLLSEFMNRCLKYFAFSGGQGRLIDQPFQPRITEGLIRSYLVKDRVVGFARQYPAGQSPADVRRGGTAEQRSQNVFGLPAAKTMYGPEEPAFASLRQSLETDWVPAMQSIVEVDTAALPALWDADFLFGPRTHSGRDAYVLSEINVSAVAPFPDQALAPLARAVRAAIDSMAKTAKAKTANGATTTALPE